MFAIEYIVIKICSTAYDVNMCKNIWHTIALTEIRSLIKVLDPIVVCTRAHICITPKIINAPLKSFIQRQAIDAPPSKYYRNIPKNLNNTYKFLVFADPHVEYDYEEGRNGSCSAASCCTKNVGMATKKENRAGKYGFLGKCDLPPIVLMDFVKTAIEKFKPDSFLWLGDNPSHQIWNQSRKNHMFSIRNITDMFMKHPDKSYTNIGKVYPILGNHEGLPCDNFNTEGTSHKWLLTETAELWKNWFTEESYQEFYRSGSFSQIHPNSKLRIIGVNCLIHDTLNSFLWKNATDPFGIVFFCEFYEQKRWFG